MAGAEDPTPAPMEQDIAPPPAPAGPPAAADAAVTLAAEAKAEEAKPATEVKKDADAKPAEANGEAKPSAATEAPAAPAVTSPPKPAGPIPVRQYLESTGKIYLDIVNDAAIRIINKSMHVNFRNLLT